MMTHHLLLLLLLLRLTLQLLARSSTCSTSRWTENESVLLAPCCLCLFLFALHRTNLHLGLAVCVASRRGGSSRFTCRSPPASRSFACSLSLLVPYNVIINNWTPSVLVASFSCTLSITSQRCSSTEQEQAPNNDRNNNRSQSRE